jgi:ubiquinone/menaquinone biosynthesis C-methylase UbiE
MNRNVTNVIRFFMDECVPAIIRDSKWFMYPFFLIAYRGRNVKEVMNFKSKVYNFTPEEYDVFYNNLNTISRNRLTDLNKPSLDYILNKIDPSAVNAIDIGCGHGFLLEQIHSRFPSIRLHGFDIKDKSESLAYEYTKGNIEKLPFPDKSFDVVTCSHVIEHLINLDQCLAELKRITRKQLFIVTPCQRYFYYTLDEHVNFFPYKEKLTSQVKLNQHSCEKLWGDWVYLGNP